MRLSVIFPVAVLAVSIALALIASSQPRPAAARAPRTGMEMLSAFQCHRAETKRIIVHGVEDNFSPAGHEPFYLRPGRRSARTLSMVEGSSYDQSQADRVFIDSFLVPSRISKGLFVTRLKAVAGNDNDLIAIGDQTSAQETYWGGTLFNKAIRLLPRAPGWRKSGTLYSAELSAMPLEPSRRASLDARPDGRTVLDFIQAGDGERWLDVLLLDDTSVDFMGLAVCVAPPGGKGLTYAPNLGPVSSVEGVVALGCGYTGEDGHMCDPYVGDMPCETPLAVACIQPLEAPTPRTVMRADAGYHWSGGRIAFTEPVPGSRFARLADVDRYCAATFGAGWRTLTHHDGTRGVGVSGFGASKPKSSRVWVEIADQPYATCWKR